MIKTETIQNQNFPEPYPEAELHPSRNRLIVAVAAGAASLALSGCYNPLDRDHSDQVVSMEYIDTRATKKTAELNDDPLFRAASITLLDGPSLAGSGSLVKEADGSIALATVEHVARPMYGMEELVKSNGKILGSQEPKASEQPLYDVPGIGLLPITAEAPQFAGSSTPDEHGAVDRYTILQIGGDQQEMLAEAEAAGTITVPELAPLAGTYGEQMVMPLGETGREMPFVFLGNNADHTRAELVPLYVLDQNLDYAAGMAKLDAASHEVLQDSSAGDSVQDPYVTHTAVVRLQSEFLDNVRAGLIDPLEAAQNLPCMGDSGSVFLNSEGKAVGVLSEGQSFYNADGNYKADDMYAITREGRDVDVTRYCLGSVEISAPPTGH